MSLKKTESLISEISIFVQFASSVSFVVVCELHPTMKNKANKANHIDLNVDIIV